MGAPKPHPECVRAFEVGFRNPEEGLRLLDDLLAREPKAFGAYNVYGQLSLRTGDLTTARDAFERNIAAWPEADHRGDWSYLSLIAGLLGDEVLSKEFSQKAGAIEIQQEFRNLIRQAYFDRMKQKGRTVSRLSDHRQPPERPSQSPCPDCGTVNDAEAAFCIACGLRLRPEQTAPASQARPTAAPPPASEAPARYPCPSCSFENSLDSDFCTECGFRLGVIKTGSGIRPPEPHRELPSKGNIRCPACTFENTIDSAYCVECGASLMPEAEEPVPAMEPAPQAEPEEIPPVAEEEPAASRAEAAPGAGAESGREESSDSLTLPQIEAIPILRAPDSRSAELRTGREERPEGPAAKPEPSPAPRPRPRAASSSDSSVTATLRASRKEFSTGAIFADRYQIVEELGQGGMGRVYRALDKKVMEEIAIKVVRAEIASEPRILERFSNELRNARRISHKNICRMYDLFESDGVHYITMEYVPGENLKSFIRRSRRLAVGTALAIAKQVAQGLEEAHRLGVIHRDLKPQNIMIDSEGNVRIMDFGIASSLKTRGITVQGMMIGTPDYMSPEQVEGRDADRRTDLYSLGVVLYEMVTGRVPFEGDTPLSVAIKHKNLIPPDPAALNPQIPEDLKRLILKCLEKDRDKRFAGAGELIGELDRIEQGIPTAERLAPEPKQAEEALPRAASRPRKFLLPAIVIATLAVAALAVWFVILRPKPGEKPSQAREVPALPVAPARKTAQEILALGFQNLRENKYEEALDSFRKLLAEQPSYTEAMLGTALVLMGQGRLEEAVTELEKITRLDPSDPRPYEHLGDIHAGRRDATKALEAYARFLERSPTGEAAAVVRNKAEILRTGMEVSASPPAASKQAALPPKPPPSTSIATPTSPASDISGPLALGIEAYHQKDYENCMRHMRAVLRIDPNNTTAKRYLEEAPLFLAAESAYGEGRMEDCLEQTQKILALSPSNAQALRLEEMAQQKLAPAKIKAVVDRFVQAMNTGQVLSFYESACRPALFQRIKREVEVVDGLYDQFRTQSSQLTIRFPQRNKAEVRFIDMTTGVMKSENRRRVIFEGTYVWTMERQGDEWFILSIQSLPSRK